MPGIDVKGINLNYRIDGDENAPPLLMSNSLGTDLGMWDWQIDALAASFRVIRYDSRGHGKSSAPAGPYSIEMLANDAIGLLDALNIRKTNFCGLSKGGMVGQWVGVQAGERLQRMVLANTSPFMPPRELWQQRIETALNEGMSALEKTIIERWFRKEFIEADQTSIAKVRKMILATPAQGYAACCMAIRDMDQRDSLTAIRTPTLVIVGSADPATPPDHGAMIQSQVKGAELVTLEAAHLSNVEQPQAFTSAVLDFLKAD